MYPFANPYKRTYLMYVVYERDELLFTPECACFFPPTVDGGWSNWATWSTCSVTCAGSTVSRSRTCDNPARAYSGADCSGSSTETTSCNTSPCPGKWLVDPI